MAIFNKKKSNNTKHINESSKELQLDMTSMFNLPYYDSIQRLQSASNSFSITSAVKSSMLKDPVISRVINMWISDTLQKDVLTKNIYTVDITKADGIFDETEKVTDEEINKINECIKYLRNNSNIDEELTSILYQVIINGNCTVRLGFIDGYEDTKIKLFEGEKGNKKKFLKETESITGDDLKKLLEAPNYDDYLDDDTSSKKKNKITRLSGRYYIEVLPKRIVPLVYKGIIVLYIDLENTRKVLNPKNISSFINKKGNNKTIAIKNEQDDVLSDIYTLQLGESFIDNAVTPWSMLNSVEDCTMLALMTRSAIYRLFTIEVGAMGTKETEKFLQEFKNRLTTRETINVREKYYSSAETQLPLGDSIVIPLRNGTGNVNLQTVGNDLKIDTDGPLKYFRQQLLTALGVPEGLIYGDTGNGGLINTSATKQDIRYLRTIQQFTYIMEKGLESLYKDYLKMIGVDLSKIVIDVNFAQINSEQDQERIEYEQTKQEALDRAITSLNNLGISFDEGGYTKTRELLIKRYLDQEILDAIKEDEDNLDVGQTDDSNGEGKDHEALPSGSLANSSGGPNIDIDMGDEGPTEENPEEQGEEIGGPDEPIDLDNIGNEPPEANEEL